MRHPLRARSWSSPELACVHFEGWLFWYFRIVGENATLNKTIYRQKFQTNILVAVFWNHNVLDVEKAQKLRIALQRVHCAT